MGTSYRRLVEVANDPGHAYFAFIQAVRTEFFDLVVRWGGSPNASASADEIFEALIDDGFEGDRIKPCCTEADITVIATDLLRPYVFVIAGKEAEHRLTMLQRVQAGTEQPESVASRLEGWLEIKRLVRLLPIMLVLVALAGCASAPVSPAGSARNVAPHAQGSTDRSPAASDDSISGRYQRFICGLRNKMYFAVVFILGGGHSSDTAMPEDDFCHDKSSSK